MTVIPKIRTVNLLIATIATTVFFYSNSHVTIVSAFSMPAVIQQRARRRTSTIFNVHKKSASSKSSSSGDGVPSWSSMDSSQQQQDSQPDTKVASSLADISVIVLPLLLVYISNQWSRSSIYYLVDFSSSETATSFTAMNLDIGFSEAQYGALASVAFTALYAITSLFAGGLADRYDRKFLTVGSTVAWSIATLATAMSSSGDYQQVLVARIFMGLAAAFTTPSAYTLIRDLVSKDRASLANSLYGSGVYLGGGLSSLSILLDNQIGWRGTYDVIAGYGLISALLSVALLPRDPKVMNASAIPVSTNRMDLVQEQDSTRMKSQGATSRQRRKEQDDSRDRREDTIKQTSSNQLNDIADILSRPKIRWLFAGSFFRFCSGLCIGVWGAPYFKLAFPEDSSSYAITNALIVGLCGVTSGVLGGWSADKAAAWAKQSGIDGNIGRLSIPILGSLLAVPTWYLTTHSSTFDYAMFWLAIEYLVAECWFGPTVAVLQSEVGKPQGGTAQGLFTLTGAIGNLAPSLLGVIYGQQTITLDALSNTSATNGAILSTLLANAVCAGYLLSAACFTMSATTSNTKTINTP